MRVIYKPTGQTGTIPDDKFDPNLFDRVDETPSVLKSIIPQKQDKPSMGGFVKNVSRDIGTQISGLAAIPGLIESIRQKQVTLPDVGEKALSGIIGEYKDLVTKPLKTAYDKPVTTALNILPFVPLLKGVSSLTKVDKVTKVADVVSDASKVGKVAKTIKTASKIATPVEKMGPLESFGRRLRELTVAPQSVAGARSSEIIDQIMDFARSRGYKGNSRNQLRQVSTDITSFDDEISKIIKVVKPQPVSINNLKTKFIENLKNNVDFDILTSANKKIAKSYLNKLNLINKKGFAYFDDVFKLKNEISNQVTSAYRKLSGELKTAISPKEAAAETLYKTLNNQIGELVPEVRDLTKAQSLMHDYSKGLIKMSTVMEPSSTFFSFLQPIVPISQGIIDAAGRFIWSAGTAGGKVSLDKLILGVKKITKSLLNPKQIVREAKVGKPYASITYGVGRQADQERQKNIQLGFDPESNPKEMNDLVIRLTPENEVERQGNKITPEMAIMANLILDSDNAAKINKAFQIQQEVGGMDNNTRKRKNLLNQALTTYSLLLKLSFMAEDGWRGYIQSESGRIPGVDGNYAEDLRRITEGLARQLGQTFAGEVGVATDQDVERWLNLAPRPGDTYQERIRRLKDMKYLIEGEANSFDLY